MQTSDPFTDEERNFILQGKCPRCKTHPKLKYGFAMKWCRSCDWAAPKNA